jgi:NAD-dependent dihydropyrimidine dehydrogenase PreA subunit
MDEKRCTTCHQMRPRTDFNLRRSARDGLQDRCRPCSREWYAGNRDEHIRRVALRNKRVRGEHQELMATFLREHPCVDCGESDLRVLELDHEDPAEKTANVGRLLASALPWSTVLAEVEKCSVRCANCHRRRTAESFTWWRSAAEARRRNDTERAAEARLAAVLGLP